LTAAGIASAENKDALFGGAHVFIVFLKIKLFIIYTFFFVVQDFLQIKKAPTNIAGAWG